MPVGKEPMTAETYDEDAYRDKLVNDGYSEETAKMLAAKKKESLAAKVGKIEIDLSSLAKDNEEFEHLSSEERKKRQEEREKRQKERAAHRIARQKQHDEVESGIPEGE